MHRFLRIAFVMPALAFASLPASADHTPNPTNVTLPGSFQSELGCGGDWDPACANTHLTYVAGEDLWKGTFLVPAGSWEYKVAINDSWTENYGVGGQQDGPNISLNLAQASQVSFIYDHHSHVVTTSNRIVVAPGSFQSEIGCPGDWDPGCLNSQLLDPEQDQTYSYSTSGIPVGDYEFKIAIGLSWNENYGQGGINGANIPFNVPAAGSFVTIKYNDVTHAITVTVEAPTATRTSSWGRIKTIYR
jgi:hypothetical protein